MFPYFSTTPPIFLKRLSKPIPTISLRAALNTSWGSTPEGQLVVQFMQVVQRRRAWATPSVTGSFPSTTSFRRIIFPRALVIGLLVKSKMGQTARQNPHREHCVMALRLFSSYCNGLVISPHP